MNNVLDLIGVGVGPFNLSLAALLEKTNLNYHFFDSKPDFAWHSEILFKDSDMQTSFLKDLATSVDPTSPYTFLNYLVETGLFHMFMNTNRTNVSRREFEQYCLWATQKMQNKLSFSSQVDSIEYDNENFVVYVNNQQLKTKHLSIATGLTPRIPECAQNYISPKFFHARSPYLKDLDLTGKVVTVVGGGQTGIEIFRNALRGMWKDAKKVNFVTGRMGLLPLDESPFTNEFFTPSFINEFFDIDFHTKEDLVKAQKLSSDGNTPQYLDSLYKELYQLKFVEGSKKEFSILPLRRLWKVEQEDQEYKLIFDNHFTNKFEELRSDIVILCTGFETLVPKALEPIKHKINLDFDNRFYVNRDFTVKWEHGETNKIYALNFSRHIHGISEPQTSLMAWRSASVVNSLMDKEFYKTSHYVKNFMSFI